MEEKINPALEESWKVVLETEFIKPYFRQLKLFLVEEKTHYQVYPPGSQIFAAFSLTPFDQVRVVILGQDPYHGAGQAHGLCFSVPAGVPKPPSLQNIFKELHRDIGISIPATGDLTAWARQGVLLINATLTVRANQAGSHQKKGWETFTDAVIRSLSEKREGLVFLLWGNYARNKAQLIDNQKHHVLMAPHPSPLSAHAGFLGCGHFSSTNALLREQGQKEIDWSLSTD